MIVTELAADGWLLSQRQVFRLADAVVGYRVCDREMHPYI